MKRPLDGIRVLDFTHALAGPFCTYHLAMLGADVIKVERPRGGDDFRHYSMHPGLPGMSAPFIAANSGKRSIVIDLKAPAAAEVLRRLILRSDVMVENFRPGVPKKLGIDWETVKGTNPRIIYCSITGFGQTGAMRDWPAYDHVVQAVSGAMMTNGEPGSGPLKVGFPLSDTFAGFMAAYAILAALLQRGSDGEGQAIDVSLMDATMVMLAQVVAGTALTGEPPKRTGNRGFRLVSTSDTYKTRDGYLAIGANHQHQVVNLFEVLGARHLLTDERFATDAARMQNNDALHEILTDILAEQSASELERKLVQAQVPAGRVRSLDEVIDEPHVAERGLLLTTALPNGQSSRIVGKGYRSTTDVAPTPTAAPRLAEHADEILSDLGYTRDEIARLKPLIAPGVDA